MNQIAASSIKVSKYTEITEDNTNIDRSTKLNYSYFNNSELKRDDSQNFRKSIIQKVSSQINAERFSSPLDDHLNQNGIDNQAYLQALEIDNIEMKKKLNQELKRSSQLVKILQQMEDKEYEYQNFCNVNNKDLQAENRALKARLLKQNDEYNKLYYELQVIKNEGNKIRHHTVHILNKNN